MRNLAKRLAGWFAAGSESGVTAIEYALAASLIAMAIAGAAGLLGTNLAGLYSNVANKIPAPPGG
jgi:pilus assembly protein Flp/PilA